MTDTKKQSSPEMEAVIEARVEERLNKRVQNELERIEAARKLEDNYKRVDELESTMIGLLDEMDELRSICRQVNEKMETFAQGNEEMSLSLQDVEKGQLSPAAQRKVYAAALGSGGGLLAIFEIIKQFLT